MATPSWHAAQRKSRILVSVRPEEPRTATTRQVEPRVAAEQASFNRRHPSCTKKNPRQFPAGGSVRSDELILEVALSADQHVDDSLILCFVERCRLGEWPTFPAANVPVYFWSRRSVHVHREGKALDRRPDDVAADHTEVEVGAASAGEPEARRSRSASRHANAKRSADTVACKPHSVSLVVLPYFS